MLESSNPRKTTPTNFSFEHILSWFGKFTPQFKFKLMALRRETTLEQFDSIMNETMTLFRAFVFDLSTQPKGSLRALRVFEMMDAEGSANPVGAVSCAAGCGACCKTFAKQITSDEADLLSELVISGKVEIDTRLLAKQAKDAKAPCVFLSEDGRCGVYSARPAVCRKYHVVSPKENCGSDTLPVIPKIDLVPELIASAALSLPDNKIGFMNDLLNERINRPIQFEAALPGLDIAP